MELLTPISQTYRRSTQNDEWLSPSQSTKPTPTPEPKVEFRGASPEESLEVLKNQPTYETLLSVLNYLHKGIKGRQPFDIRQPGPRSAQIVHVLVTDIVPNYWTVLREASNGKTRGDEDLLLDCLQSLTGINAVLAYLRALLREAKSDPKGLKNSHTAFNLSFALDLLSKLLQPDDEAPRIWDAIKSSNNPAQLRPMRQELISLLTSGKIISLSAEAEDACREAGKLDEPLWTGDGKRYIEWIGRNIAGWTRMQSSDEDLKLCAEISARAMRLGHSESLIKKMFTDLLLRDDEGQTTFGKLLGHFPPLEQRKMLLVILKLLSDMYLNSLDSDDSTEEYPGIWAATGVLKIIIGDDEARKGYLRDWLTSASGAGIGEGIGIRRAAVAVLAGDKNSISTLLEKSLSQFGDQLYIRHAPTLQQEAHAQVLLLSAGYTHRIAPMKLTILLRSSPYLNAISNRIAASQSRARFLGMVAGEALSGLVHQKETKLDFKMDEMDTDEANWYKSLVHVSDKAGPLDPLRTSPSQPESAKKMKKSKNPPEKPALKPRKVPPKTGIVIEEVEDDDEDEDPDLVPYAKPDSDAEDSDDDPTLITRDKPKAPVYIRDLISYFRDTENYDLQKLALTTAPTLIRRKANYGTEVSSHAEELAALLVGLQDKYDLENFHDLRLQGMVAIVVAQPKKMGQWFTKTFFDGDYSLSQRASVLITLGLSGREIAGFETSEYASAAQFPSKTLPAKVEKHYTQPSASRRLQPSGSALKALPPNALDNLAQSLSQTFLAPLAAEAADAATGPDALKLSSFTSRLQAQPQTQSGTPSSYNVTRKPQKPRGVRAIPNTTASLLGTSFFFPLTSRFQAAMRSTAASGVLFEPHLLALYLKTLALLLHAAGPSTLALPQMTAEFWDLLLGVRGQCGPGGPGVTRAVLFGLVALLDVNEGDMRGLCERHGREVVESVEWAGGVFDNTRGGDGDGEGEGEENEVKMLAAGVLIRLREAMEKYQALLMGEMIGVT